MSDDNCLDAASGTSPVKLVREILKELMFNRFSSRCGAMDWGVTRPGCGGMGAPSNIGDGFNLNQRCLG